MPLKNFPWAAYIIGNLARFWCKGHAIDYFEMAIAANPPLELAKLGLAITYTDAELDMLGKAMPTYDDKAGVRLPAAMMRNDFVLSYRKLVDECSFQEAVYRLYPNGSLASFEFLQENYEYFFILCHFESFSYNKIIEKTKEELFEKWLQKMEEEKDPIVASQMAAALMEVYDKATFLLSFPEAKIAVDRVKCIHKGGFTYSSLARCSIDQRIQILKRIISEKIPLRPGGLGVCWMMLGKIYANNHNRDHFNLKNAFDCYWQAVREGEPSAIPELYIIIRSMNFTYEFSLQPDDGPTRLFLFQICFTYQQDIYWHSNIGYMRKKDSNKYSYTRSGFRLPYSYSDNAVVRTTAFAAQGLRYLSERDYKEAASCFNEARKNLPVFQEYFAFARKQGYLLLPEALQFVRKFLETPLVSDNKEHFLVRLVKRGPAPLMESAPSMPAEGLISSPLVLHDYDDSCSIA